MIDHHDIDPNPLRHPADVAEASKAWGATCGPCSLAAALGRDVEQVRAAVSDQPEGELPGLQAPSFRGYMTIGQMKTAVVRAGAHLDREWSPATPRGLDDLLSTPTFAGAVMLVCVQWGGPWPPRAAAVHRHWVAMRRASPWPGDEPELMVYDWNAKHRVIIRTIGRDVERGSGTRWSEREEVRAGGWLDYDHWLRELPPRLKPDRGDGSWTIQWAGAVRR
jgi:hypothetical protein